MGLHVPEVQHDTGALLVPDDVDEKAPVARMWRDAAAEEGILFRCCTRAIGCMLLDR